MINLLSRRTAFALRAALLFSLSVPCTYLASADPDPYSMEDDGDEQVGSDEGMIEEETAFQDYPGGDDEEGFDESLIYASAKGGGAPPLLPAGEHFYAAWQAEYLPGIANSQSAAAVALDQRGNVYMTGTAKSAGLGTDQIYTAKYDALDGHLVWSVFVRGNGASQVATETPSTAYDIVVDSEGSVIVTGSINTNGIDDLYVVKYSSLGVFVWSKQYDGTAHGADAGNKVAVDGADAVLVTGVSRGDNGNPTGDDIYTVKYSKAGAFVWEDRYNSSGNQDDAPASMVVDGTGNTIVVGTANKSNSSAARLYVRKLSSAGAVSWEKVVDTGGKGGGTGVAVDAAGNVFVTGIYADANGHHGYYTGAYTAAGANGWTAQILPIADDFDGRPCGIAVGPDGNPVVSGYLKNIDDRFYAYTVKYNGMSGAKLGESLDPGLNKGDTKARAVITDGSSNTIIVGESYNGSSDDIYLAKYGPSLGAPLFSTSYDGSKHTTDLAADVAVDRAGNIAIAATPKKDVNGIGYNEMLAISYHRFLKATGDLLPVSTYVPQNAVFVSSGAPAVNDYGIIAAKITFAVGKKKTDAILLQGAAGGDFVPAVKGAPSPDSAGADSTPYASFTDPLIAADGSYAFAGKITGSKAKASCVWADMNGTLKRVLQQGEPVPGVTPAVNLVSVLSLSLRSGHLVALVKVSGSKSADTLLLHLDAAGTGKVLVQKGTPLTILGEESPITALAVLNPPVLSPGDGRWQTDDGSVVARVTLKNKTQVVYKISAAGVATPLLFTGQDASVSTGIQGAKWKSFGYPAIGASGNPISVVATLAPQPGAVTAANDTMLIFSFNGVNFGPLFIEGAVISLQTEALPAPPRDYKYTQVSDPVVNSGGEVAFATALSSVAGKKTTVIPLLSGIPNQTLTSAMFLGSYATDSAGNTPEAGARWGSFTSIALPGGAGLGPIFVAKLVGVKPGKDSGIWGVDASRKVRKLLLAGDQLGTKTVKSFVLLKAVNPGFSAARSFNAVGGVVASVTFTDKTQAMVEISIP